VGPLTDEQIPDVQDARCIFAIHNLSHQGVEPADTFANFGLPNNWSAPSWLNPSRPHLLLKIPPIERDDTSDDCWSFYNNMAGT
jgi:hypothetical protein